jgi:flagellar hook-associated protein 3 FlgL
MTGVSTLGQALEQIERIKEQQSQLALLSLQVTSGKKTQQFSGLGNDIMTSKRARANFNALDSYIDNIKNGKRRIDMMMGGIAEFKAQSRTFVDSLKILSQQSVHQQGEQIVYDDPLTTIVETTIVGMTSSEPDADLKSTRQLADNIYNIISDLLNIKDGDRYLFGGAETLIKPFDNTGTLDAAISNLIDGWKNGTITNDQLMADLSDRTTAGGNLDALTDTITGYSSVLSAGNGGRVFIRVDQNAEVNYTTLANDQAFRDIMVGLSYIRNANLVPIADTYEPPNTYPGVPDVQGAPGTNTEEMKENFFEVYNHVITMVTNAIERLDQLSYNLGNAQSRIEDVKLAHEQDKNVLQTTISDVENVDINEAAVKLTALETQINASYAVTAKLQQLSLVNFLFVS